MGRAFCWPLSIRRAASTPHPHRGGGLRDVTCAWENPELTPKLPGADPKVDPTGGGMGGGEEHHHEGGPSKSGLSSYTSILVDI